MSRPQFSLKTLLTAITAICVLAALVASVSKSETRLAIAFAILRAGAPLGSALVLFLNCGRSRWLSIAAWGVALVSLTVRCGIVALAPLQAD